MLGVCRRALGRSADVDDAFQATFLVLVRKAATIRRQQAVSSWLYGVARRLALQVRRGPYWAYLTVAIDGANGSTYEAAPRIFSRLGAEVIELACDPDGRNAITEHRQYVFTEWNPTAAGDPEAGRTGWRRKCPRWTNADGCLGSTGWPRTSGTWEGYGSRGFGGAGAAGDARSPGG